MKNSIDPEFCKYRKERNVDYCRDYKSPDCPMTCGYDPIERNKRELCYYLKEQEKKKIKEE